MQKFVRSADLAAFRRALELGAVPDRGFGVSADDIALVESAWQVLDTVVSSHGWVLTLKSGRRLHLEYTLDRTQCSAAEELEIAVLRPGQSRPTLEDAAGVHWCRPDHINAHLGIIPPSLH